jgi:predicted DNA-binding protein
MPTLEAPPLAVLDYRRPGQSLPPLSLRLPPEMVVGLDSQANRLRTTRAGLVRALLAQGLEKLEVMEVMEVAS